MVKYGIYNKADRKNVYFTSIMDARKYAIRYAMSCENMVWINTTMGKKDTVTIRIATKNNQLDRIVEEIYAHKVLGSPEFYCDRYDDSGKKIDYKRIDPKTGKTSKSYHSERYLQTLRG